MSDWVPVELIMNYFKNLYLQNKDEIDRIAQNLKDEHLSNQIIQEIIASIKIYVSLNDQGRVQMFDHKGWDNDDKELIYKNGDIKVLYCRDNGYVEILGLNDKDFKRIFDVYGFDL